VTDEPVSIHFDRAADFYDETRAVDDETTSRAVDILAGEVQGRGTVLEIGVGTGIMALPLVERGVEVVGIDLSDAMLRRLIGKSGGARLPVVRADATRLPFADDTFGSAYARHVLHLIPRWEAAVRELCRVVGGGVVLIEAGGSAGGGWHDLWETMREAIGPVGDHVGLDMSANGRAELDDAFRDAGAIPRDLPAIEYEDRDTIASVIAEVDRRTPSWTWRVSDEDIDRAIDAARRYATERYGTLDVTPDETASVRWRAFDLA
jgi:SAM-dependent methyltransferase